VESLFLSASFDGSVKMWDIRNDEKALASLKSKSKDTEQDYKVFTAEWNGTEQILTGGSNSQVSVFSMQ
jgi:WD40 repeat protein